MIENLLTTALVNDDHYQWSMTSNETLASAPVFLFSFEVGFTEIAGLNIKFN